MEQKYHFHVELDKFVCPGCNGMLHTKQMDFKLTKNYPLLKQFTDQGGVKMSFVTLCHDCKQLFTVYCLCRDVDGDVDVTVYKIEKVKE